MVAFVEDVENEACWRALGVPLLMSQSSKSILLKSGWLCRPISLAYRIARGLGRAAPCRYHQKP